MFQAIYEYSLVTAPGGVLYRPRAYAELDSDGRWGAWLVFFPVTGNRVIGTPRETSQESFAAVIDWAAGLSPVYLEGAVARALALQSRALRRTQPSAVDSIEADAPRQMATLERIGGHRRPDRRRR